MTLPHYPVDIVPNKAAEWRAYGDRERDVLNLAALSNAEGAITSWPGYAPTPLVFFDGLARDLGLGAIGYKDEAHRFDLKSFKALGGAYAVMRLLADRVAAATGVEAVAAEDLRSGRYRALTETMTVCCATDGNHGRSVAWGARLFGCRSVIFIHETVSDGRKTAIEGFGAEVRRVAGNYDDSVRAAQQAAEDNGWTVVSDTSYPGYTDIPCDVMQGYALMAKEADAQWAVRLGADRPPTHLFVQAGVGGVAAAVISYFWERRGAERPMGICVEPDKAACVHASIRDGRRVAVEGDLDTIMAGLACGEVSLVAWPVLHHGLDAVIALPDWTAEDMMRRLAGGLSGAAPLVAGESGVTGLAGLVAAAGDPETRALLRLGPEARALVFGTEGATDDDVYRAIVGQSSDAVAAA